MCAVAACPHMMAARPLLVVARTLLAAARPQQVARLLLGVHGEEGFINAERRPNVRTQVGPVRRIATNGRDWQ